MASHDYYNKPLPNPSPQPSPAPYYQPYSAPSATSYPPSYTSQQPDRQTHNVSPITSPFETVFDDHVYPVSSHQSGATSHQHLPHDSAYHGLARTPSDDMHRSDDIPLQNRQPKDPYGPDGPEGPDHVYEAPRRKKSRKGVRFGELGMFGSNRKRIPIFTYLFTIVQVAVFIGTVVRNAQLTGSPIMIRPQFNPMIGPSTYVLINMGSRFVPCMHNVDGVQNANTTTPIGWPCPNTTSSDLNAPENKCTLSDLCGFGGVPNPDLTKGIDQSPQPNQWWRFIVPMFMHAGLIHIGFNMLLQLTLAREMEMSIGPIRFVLVYISAGIFGFVMGGNYAATGISSTGASGSLFGIIALTLLDLLYSWKDRRNPIKDLSFIMLDIVISFVLGLLPGLDNFSHIGGFLMGLALGISVLHSPNSLRRRIGEEDSYASVNRTHSGSTSPSFFRSPIGFFKGRKPLWWAWWLIRAGALVLVTVVFIVLLNNFYIYHNKCDWCKYLSCLPINDWCTIGNLQLKDSTPKV